MTIAPVARAAGLGFIALAEEHYDFALVTARKAAPGGAGVSAGAGVGGKPRGAGGGRVPEGVGFTVYARTGSIPLAQSPRTSS